MSQPPTDADRFWPEVYKTSECWLWMGFTRRGYGAFWHSTQKWVGAHRFAYEAVNGPIGRGYQLDHLCRITSCVRPDHLEAVTPGENSRRKPRPTHCPHGHEYTPDNIYQSNQRSLICKTCFTQRSRDFQRRKFGRDHLIGLPPQLNAEKTECKNGHPFTPENTRTYGSKRQCVTCSREAMQRYRAKQGDQFS